MKTVTNRKIPNRFGGYDYIMLRGSTLLYGDEYGMKIRFSGKESRQEVAARLWEVRHALQRYITSKAAPTA